MATSKKNSTKITKRTPSREDLINLLNEELVKIEMEFTQNILNKFDKIISNYPLTANECVMLLRENRKELGSAEYQKFYVDIIDNVFDIAEQHYETDFMNGKDYGFYDPILLAMEHYLDDEG